LVWEKPFDHDATFTCAVDLQLERQAAKTGDASITCNIAIKGEGTSTVNHRQPNAKIFVTARKDNGELELQVGGSLNIEGLEFNLLFSKEAEAHAFLTS